MAEFCTAFDLLADLAPVNTAEQVIDDDEIDIVLPDQILIIIC